ncbi:MAG: hypothetical protein KY396_09140, partial [Actinobacteria bacterium]|nr:hypothetical protein [Actinomycetota bacterium]
MPAVVVFVVAVGLMARAPEYGVAAVLALVPLTNLTVGEGSAAAGIPAKPVHFLIPTIVFGLFAYGAIVVRARRLA